MANSTFTPEQISQILEEFFKVVGTRQYIGARYVPIFGRKGEESIQWDNSEPYEPLTIVLYQGNSYTSRQHVPIGVDINNETFWALTGNYNAQIEQYRAEVAAITGSIDDINEIAASANRNANAAVTALGSGWSSENTVRTELNEVSKNLSDLGETVSDLDATLTENVDVSNMVDVLYGKIRTRDVSESSYLYANPPAPTWSAIQGLCYTKNGKFAATLSPSLEYYRTHDSIYLNTVVIKEFNADGTLNRTSAPIAAGHANSITYNAARDELVIATNYYLNSTTFEREASSTIMVYRYSDFNFVGTYDYSEYLTGTANGVSYDEKSGTLMVFDGDDFNAIYVSPETYEYLSALDISCFESIYLDTVQTYDASRRQSIQHNDNYIVFAFYMPNMFVFATRTDIPEVVKIVQNYDEYAYEMEDFDLDNSGNVIYSAHKRYYTRNSTQECVMNMFTIYESNFYTNGYPFDWADGSAVSTSRQIDVNPSTTNVIQNGSTTYPCKTVMEAYFLYAARHNSAEPLQIRIPANASGTIKFMRMTEGHVTIDCNSSNVGFVANARLTHGFYIMDAVHFVDSTDIDCVKYPFSANGDISFLYSMVWLINCDLYSGARPIELNNDVYIGSNSIAVNPRNHYLYNAPGQASIANGFGGPVS